MSSPNKFGFTFQSNKHLQTQTHTLKFMLMHIKGKSKYGNAALGSKYLEEVLEEAEGEVGEEDSEGEDYRVVEAASQSSEGDLGAEEENHPV